MKPYHECGVVKDGNKRAQYFVTQTDSCVDQDIVSKPWSLISSEDFERLVQGNQVQMLVWENNTIKCRYSQEEMQLMERYFKKDYIAQTMEDYWNMDVSFKQRHITAAYNKGAIACSVGAVMKVFGQAVVPMYMYGGIVSMSGMVREFESLSKISIAKQYKHNGQCIGSLTLPYNFFVALLEEVGKKYGLLFDTSTMRWTVKVTNVARVPLIVKNAQPNLVLELADKCDRLTNHNEEIFCN